MQLIRLLAVLVLLLTGVLANSLSSNLVQAQETETQQPEKPLIDKRKLLVQPKNADGSVIETPFFEDPMLWIRSKQQNIYSKLRTSLFQLRSGNAATAGWTLFTLSFLYGVFHAAGPGHGKAVITGWVLATERQLRRGVLIAFLSSIMQALTAIVIVSALLLFVKGASRMARDVAGFLESASYAMIGAMGLYLIWTALRGHSHSHDPVPARPHQEAKAIAHPAFELVSRPVAAGNIAPVHDHSCGPGCGHAHLPAAAELKDNLSWYQTFAMAFAVGIRPCSGAILVLIAAYTLGIYWAGIASTLAMGVGVFLTVAIIAVTAVYAKNLALKLTFTDTPGLANLAKWAKIAAGLAIAGLGALLFSGSIGSNSMMM